MRFNASEIFYFSFVPGPATIGFEQLFIGTCPFYPIMKLFQMILAHHDKSLFCRSCDVQQVTDYRNQH